MKQIILISVILLFLMPAIKTNAQVTKNDTVSTIQPNKIIAPYQRHYLQYKETKDGLVTSSMMLTRKLEPSSYKGVSCFLITQKYQTEKFIDVDSSYVTKTDLRPLAYFTQINSEGHREEVTFNKTEILNKVIINGTPTNNVKINRALYNVVIADDIISVLPLKEGSVFILKMVNPGKRYYEFTQKIVVEGEEELPVPFSENIKCWRIKVQNGEGNYALQWYTVKGMFKLKQNLCLTMENLSTEC